ncbi:MAG: DUF5320 domain-containing protein [Elusimicrobiota bacterium]|nr:DUF5320 domain-containing protein [Elusimicrobiota bacterium]
MARGDGTGPDGLGPMTGRGAGYCAGFDVPGYANPGVGAGRGFGAGRGMGRGVARRGGGRGFGFGRSFAGAVNPYYGQATYVAPPAQQTTPAQEAEMLKNEAKALETEMKIISNRLKSLESQAAKAKKK